MPDISSNVRRLAAAALALRKKAPIPERALPPFSLALFTDERRQEDILSLLSKIPTASEIGSIALIFRHYGLRPDERMGLAKAAMQKMHSCDHRFLMARSSFDGADGSHAYSGRGIISWPVHSPEEARSANDAGADFGFLSPVFPTTSHPTATGLGRAGLKELIAETPIPAFALGGISPDNANELLGLPIYGIGAIGAWSG